MPNSLSNTKKALLELQNHLKNNIIDGSLETPSVLITNNSLSGSTTQNNLLENIAASLKELCSIEEKVLANLSEIKKRVK